MAPPKPLRLYLDYGSPPHVLRFIRPGGAAGAIPGLRLITYANFLRSLIPSREAADYAICECVIDTGSFLSVVPQRIWRHFLPGLVTPLPFDPSTPHGLRFLTIAGGTHPFDLGEITLRLEDRSGEALNVTLVAKFTRDGGALRIPLTLGLRGGVLDGRVLRAEPDPTAPHGQAWSLADP
jgi:hypothetical protein